MKRVNPRFEWRDIFLQVIEAYQQVKSTTGSIGSLNYEKALDGSSGGACSKYVKPSMSDFIGDVELAARAALSTNEELRFFYDHYVPVDAGRPSILTNAAAQREQASHYGETAVAEVPNNALNLAVMEKVGRVLQAKGIFPLGSYFRARDVR